MTPQNLPAKVMTFTEENSLFSAPCHLLLGLSGGADSMALLHVLMHWPTPGIQVSAIHVNHGLRGDAADRDEAFVCHYCAEQAIPLTVRRADVAAEAARTGVGLEEAGRAVRYALFEELRQELGADYIVTAHTASDQTETVLMRLVRGCGIDGLSGIPASRGVIRRPLLCCDRQEIETYCRDKDVPYITDETNEDPRYTRNRVRHQVLPLLRQLNPSVDRALLRLADHADADSRFLREVSGTALGAASLSGGGYDIGCFVTQLTPIRRRMISQAIADAAISSVEETHILAIERALFHGSGTICLPDGVTARVYDGRLLFYASRTSEEPPAPFLVDSLPFSAGFAGAAHHLFVCECPPAELAKNVHKLFFKNTIDYDRIQGSLWLRCRREGDILRPAGRGISKSLKKLMNEWRIPAHRRDSYPLLCDEAGILMVPGYTCDERVRVTADTKHFLVWQTDPEQG